MRLKWVGWIWSDTRRKLAGNRPVFTGFQRCCWLAKVAPPARTPKRPHLVRQFAQPGNQVAFCAFPPALARLRRHPDVIYESMT